jgi:tritrans,polycis-undecaprenyl-diphosphate synthase [geranylgeranyl-diphosphate specific]
MTLKHLGLILDGNRRFAKRLMKQPWKGHEWGAAKIEHVIDWSSEMGIQELTMYAFSVQNFNRPKKEFDFLMDVFRKEFDRMCEPDQQEKLAKEGVQIDFIGRMKLFAPDIQEKMKRLMKLTAKNDKMKVHFAMAYGGQEEILDAIAALSKKIRTGDINEITRELFEDHLYMKSAPDLIIRTGGDRRTSNFLTWQSSYSEWLFLEKFWPEFDKTDLIAATEDFEQRERRFGK